MDHELRKRGTRRAPGGSRSGRPGRCGRRPLRPIPEGRRIHRAGAGCRATPTARGGHRAQAASAPRTGAVPARVSARPPARWCVRHPRTAPSAASGNVRWTGSATARMATNGSSCTAATRAAMCDSMSTATASVLAPSANLADDNVTRASLPAIGAWIASGCERRIACDQRGVVAIRCPSAITSEATTSAPGRSADDNPPAIPKLTMPRQPADTARVNSSAKRWRSPPQTTKTPGPDAIRVSNARPVTATMRDFANNRLTPIDRPRAKLRALQPARGPTSGRRIAQEIP